MISYRSRDEFCTDVRQMFINCEVFNEDDSPVGKAGHGMRNFFETRWTEITGSPPSGHPPVHSWGSVRVRSGCNSFAHFYYWRPLRINRCIFSIHGMPCTVRTKNELPRWPFCSFLFFISLSFFALMNFKRDLFKIGELC